MLRELGEQVHAGETSAVELVRRAYERVGERNATINAVIGVRDEDEAMAEARALDDRVRAGQAAGPLAGVPFLVKDNHDLAGMRTTQGTRVLADVPPAARDSLCVARLRAAGAIPIGKTNVPEFCFEGYTGNSAYGVTVNPWAREWTPGGSSGGSAAAMAAGMIPFATATDGGGSIRIPASFCGLFGIKPTNGLVGRQPVPAWIDYSTDGPIALSMDDLRLLLAIQCGPAPGDPTALPAGLAVRLAGLSDAAAVRPGVAGEAGTGTGANGAGARRGAPGGRKPSLVLAAPRLVDAGPLPGALPDLFDAALTSLEKDLGLTVEPIAPGSGPASTKRGAASTSDGLRPPGARRRPPPAPKEAAASPASPPRAAAASVSPASRTASPAGSAVGSPGAGPHWIASSRRRSSIESAMGPSVE